MQADQFIKSLRVSSGPGQNQNQWLTGRAAGLAMHDDAPDTSWLTARTGRVGLLNVYSSRNLGDAAIMTALASLVPDQQVIAPLRDSQPVPMTGVHHTTAMDAADRFISVGGDIFNNARPWLATRSFIRNAGVLAAAGRRGILFGQTVPASCKGPALIGLALAMRRLSGVVVRDRESFSLLRSLGVRARLSFDSAFVISATEAGRTRARAMLDEAAIEPSRAALISVRSFDALYPSDQVKTEQKLADLARRLHERGHQPAILIQSDVDHADSDLQTARRLSARVPELKILDCINRADDPAPVDTLVGLLAIANIAVGLRYHTTVLRLAAGRRAFNLHYSRKGRDLSTRLSLPGIHIDDFDVDRDIRAIEDSADNLFDVTPVAQNVRASFREAYGAIQ